MSLADHLEHIIRRTTNAKLLSLDGLSYAKRLKHPCDPRESHRCLRCQRENAEYLVHNGDPDHYWALLLESRYGYLCEECTPVELKVRSLLKELQ